MQLVLYYNPVVSGTDPDSLEAFKQSQQLMVFWQELFFREERLQLPFMENARERERMYKKYDIPADAFNRVGGLVFLDMAFAPDSNKTIIAGELRTELFESGSHSVITREYTRLQEEFHQKVKSWHEEFDRMVDL